MLFFLRSWCYFSSSAVALLVGISKFKHIYEAELQLSTRFPFHCQDRFMLSYFLEFFSRSKKVSKKWCPRVPKWTPKVDQNQQKRRSGGVSKRDLKKEPSPGTGQVRYGCYVLHFSKVRGLRKGRFLVIISELILETKAWKQGSRTASKKVLKIDTHFTRFWVHFGDHFWVKSRSFAGRRWVWHVDP